MRVDHGGRSLWVALATATIMIAHQVAGKAARDALFLSHFDVSALPRAMVIGAVLSLLAVLAMSKLLPRIGPTRMVAWCFVVSGALFVAEWMLYGAHPRVAAAVLYLHMAVFGAILISGFWSVINERFDPHTAKETVAQVTAATALGGLVGGVIAERVGTSMGVESTLVALAALHWLCAAGVRHIGVVSAPDAITDSQTVTSGLRAVARMPYLRAMAVLVMLTAMTAALLDFTLKAEAKARFEDGSALIAFFAAYYAVTGVAGFLVQSTLGPRLLQQYGIGVALAMLPAFTLLAGAVAAVVQHFATMVLVRGGQVMLANSLHRSASELLYTPLPPDQKRPTKTIVDVAADRVGDMVGAGLVLLVLALVPAAPAPLLLALAVVAAAGALYYVRRLHYGYVEQLARGLRRGAVTVDAERVVDATTQHILAETSVYTEREQLMAKIREMREARRTLAVEPLDHDPAEADPATNSAGPAPHGDPSPAELRALEQSAPSLLQPAPRVDGKSQRFARAVADLTSGDPVLVRRALGGDFMDIRLVPYLIPLLGKEEVAADARMELRWQVPRIIGQLTDALLDPDLPVRARQRLPSVLEVCHNPRAIDALLLGLEDAEFSVRYSAARALARMRSRNPSLRIARSAVFRAVRLEVALEPAEWRARRLVGDTAFDGSSAGPTNRTLEHVFTLLSLVHDPDALQLAMQAIGSRDGYLRGTALEYLENVLPDDIRQGLWYHLGVRQPARAGRARPRGEVVRELRASAAQLGKRGEAGAD
ncbi:MAG: hypothetical protein H6983_17710 [Ectothiorhodospiraceae bacterium]|nr:hypothetical protein [Chromatiales bacterium]MCP5156013.1 hypothetical protein [Ectothiorhodospiraceae bacterium]